ncbi:MAG: helix-turn-helix domain-containing protein [Lachnospiraceae bacterium]|nr:helix-turn-helix domain-containing protein [Lachnospiraceae bacterium]
MIGMKLQILRKRARYSQEYVAQHLNVSRQAVAKWENDETTPDLGNCIKLAQLYEITLDELASDTDPGPNGELISPPGKHFFGTVTVNDRGQIVIPKKAREIFKIKPGDELLFLGDEGQGLALVKTDAYKSFASHLLKALYRREQ